MKRIAKLATVLVFAAVSFAPLALAQINQGVNATPPGNSPAACSVPGCVPNPSTGVCYCTSGACQATGCTPGATTGGGSPVDRSGNGGLSPTLSQSNYSGGGINTSYLQSYAGSIIGIINGLLVPILLAIAFLFFMWGVVNYFIFGATSEEKREQGRHFVLWSVIGFAVIFSVWGLVGVVGSTLGLSPGGTAPAYPTL